MNKLTTMYAVLALAGVLGWCSCASTPEGQKIQLQGWVKIAAQAALEEQEMSAAELEQLAAKLEELAGQADGGVVPLSVASLGAAVNDALGLQGYKAAIVDGLLLQADVMLADQGVVLDGAVLDVAKYSELLRVAAKGVRQAIP